MKKAADREDLIQMLVSDEARRLNADLDRRCDHRSRELYLLQTEMESLSYCLAHDLRPPLIHIAGFVDLLVSRQLDLDQKSRHYLEIISTATARLGRMIDELALLSRGTSPHLQTVSLDFEVLANQVVEEVRRTAGDRTMVWSVGAMPMVDAEPTLLREVLKELLSNAVKFTAGRVEAQISVTSRRGERETIISVRDNGVGFDMKHRDRLFTIFQRLHGATEFPGLGVGLARVRRAIQRHGGRTWADGLKDTGAAFHFSLPDDGMGHA